MVGSGNERRGAAPWMIGVAVAMLAVGAEACGGARPADAAVFDRRASSGSSMYELGPSDLARASDAVSLFQAIERLRPNFLRARGAQPLARGRAPQINVFINGNFAGPVDILRTIPVEQVGRARFVQPVEAATQYGSNRAGDGIIELVLVRPVRIE